MVIQADGRGHGQPRAFPNVQVTHRRVMGVKKRRSLGLIRERFVRGYVRAYIQGKTSEK